VRAAPLLEKERHALLLAGSPDILDPLRSHWARSWTALAADDSPMDARQVYRNDCRRLERFGQAPAGLRR
jgi:hypothetical protein